MLTAQDNIQAIVDFYEHAPVLFSLYDENLVFVDVNQATLKFLKKDSKEDIIGKHIEEVSPGLRATGRLALYENVVRTGKSVQLRSIVTTPSVGSAQIGVYVFKAGKGVGLIAMDVSDWVQEEKAMIAQLEIKNKELEQFAYVASHDLQEPLETVSSFAGVLNKKYPDRLDDKGREYLGFIIAATKRMKKLVTDVLEYSRIGKKEEMQQVDFNALLNEVVADMDFSIREHDANITHDPLPSFRAFRTEMKELFQNLFSNAIRFRKDGELPHIHVHAEPEGTYWKFSVRDNGIGIEEKYFSRIFLIFQRLHNRSQYDGTGIGLSLCKKIVAIHGGRIWVESAPGQGSTFYFTLKETI